MRVFLMSVCILWGTIVAAFGQGLPIRPSRTIQFTTNEGSYMDVDVSPDGKTLVFDLLGDLYTVATTGGAAHQLTRGLAIRRRPVWSPDGKKIAYIGDESGSLRLNVRSIAGSFHRVLGQSDKELELLYFHNPAPLWTADGQFVSDGHAIYGLLGNKLVPKFSFEKIIRFSQDGRSVYYLDKSNLCQYKFANDLKTALAKFEPYALESTISPDGHWWAYVRDVDTSRCLMVRDLRTDKEKVLVPSLLKLDPRYGPLIQEHFCFSPDSRSLYIGYGGKIHLIGVEDGSDKIIPFIAKVRADLGSFNYHRFRVFQDSVKVKYTRNARMRSDGQQLVFSTLNRLYVKSLPNGKEHILAEQPMGQFQPAYSPDGRWIAYVTWSDTLGGGVWRVPSSGGQPERLTSVLGQYLWPAWSPDGTDIAVMHGPLKPEGLMGAPPAIGQLELITVNSGAVRVVVDSLLVLNELAFSGDGKRIIYEPMKPKNNRAPWWTQLESADLEGKDQQVEFTGGVRADPADAYQRAISPDGRFVVYSLGEDLYLYPRYDWADPESLDDETKGTYGIAFAQGVDPYWEAGGKELCWCYGNHFYRVAVDTILATAERVIANRKGETFSDSGIVSIKVRPDQEVAMNVSVPRAYAHGVIAFTHVRIITMQGNKVIDQGTVIVKDGRFLTIGSSGQVSIPQGAKVLDLPGTTVMPGFVDLHLHMITMGTGIIPQEPWMHLVNLAYGVTTARDPASTYESFGYAELLEAGQMTGPRLYTSGLPIRLFQNGIIRISDLEDAHSIVRQRALLGSTFIKQYHLPTRVQRQWLLLASKEEGLNMTNEGAYDPVEQIAMMKDGSSGIEHNPMWGEAYQDVTTFVTRSSTWLTPTLQVRYGDEVAKGNSNYLYWQPVSSKLSRFTADVQLAKIATSRPTDEIKSGFLYPSIVDARLRKQGGRVALGSHGNNEGIGVHNELWALQMGGLSNMEALQAATIIGAEGLGVQQDIGSIEVGKLADLLILNKNPLEDIHNSREIRYVMKEGILYDADTMDEVWPVAKNCPEWRVK